MFFFTYSPVLYNMVICVAMDIIRQILKMFISTRLYFMVFVLYFSSVLCFLSKTFQSNNIDGEMAFEQLLVIRLNYYCPLKVGPTHQLSCQHINKFVFDRFVNHWKRVNKVKMSKKNVLLSLSMRGFSKSRTLEGSIDLYIQR